MSKSLNFWALPAQDVAIQGSRWVGYSPLNNSSITPLEFTISELEDFVDLNQSYLTFDMRLPTGANNDGLYADGQVTAAEANQSGDDYTKYVYLVNNVAHTMIQQFDMRLNGWVNYLNVNASLQATNAVNDDRPVNAGMFATGETNPLKVLTSKFLGNGWVRLIMKPHLEAFHTGTVLVPGIEIKLRITFNSPEFFCFGTRMAGKKYPTLGPNDIQAKFYLCRLTLNPTTYTALTKRRHNKGMWGRYPTVYMDVRTFTFDGDSTMFKKTDLFQGRVPDRVMFGVTRIRQIIRGEEYPYETLELNQNDNKKDLWGYHRFLQASGALGKHQESMLKPGDWGHTKNCTLYLFNNVAGGDADSPLRNPQQQGDVTLEINFGANPGQNLTVVVWGEFESVMDISGTGVVNYDV
ncbi:uncharacterized protein F54H12.2-like [Montipora capricornis]|uniref:uncharacterized protein F54H12.2-like n=1 Tax=Montipora capricornis TaxID=246305 RepID=UPI0035F141D8